MIRALVSGKLYGQPQQRTSQSGKQYTTCKLMAEGKNGSTVWCSLIAFGDVAERLASLDAGASLSVSGRAELQAWTKGDEPHAGLSIVADELVTLKAKPKTKARQDKPQDKRHFEYSDFNDSLADV